MTDDDHFAHVQWHFNGAPIVSYYSANNGPCL